MAVQAVVIALALVEAQDVEEDVGLDRCPDCGAVLGFEDDDQGACRQCGAPVAPVEV